MERDNRGRDNRDSGDRDSRGDKQSGNRRMMKKRKKICNFCLNDVNTLDYKDINKIRKFISERGKILPRRITGNCAKHQRLVTSAIKRARIMALLGFVEE